MREITHVKFAADESVFWWNYCPFKYDANAIQKADSEHAFIARAEAWFPDERETIASIWRKPLQVASKSDDSVYG